MIFQKLQVLMLQPLFDLRQHKIPNQLDVVRWAVTSSRRGLRCMFQSICLRCVLIHYLPIVKFSVFDCRLRRELLLPAKEKKGRK